MLDAGLWHLTYNVHIALPLPQLLYGGAGLHVHVHDTLQGIRAYIDESSEPKGVFDKLHSQGATSA